MKRYCQVVILAAARVLFLFMIIFWPVTSLSYTNYMDFLGWRLLFSEWNAGNELARNLRQPLELFFGYTINLNDVIDHPSMASRRMFGERLTLADIQEVVERIDNERSNNQGRSEDSGLRAIRRSCFLHRIVEDAVVGNTPDINRRVGLVRRISDYVNDIRKEVVVKLSSIRKQAAAQFNNIIVAPIIGVGFKNIQEDRNMQPRTVSKLDLSTIEKIVAHLKQAIQDEKKSEEICFLVKDIYKLGYLSASLLDSVLKDVNSNPRNPQRALELLRIKIKHCCQPAASTSASASVLSSSRAGSNPTFTASKLDLSTTGKIIDHLKQVIQEKKSEQLLKEEIKSHQSAHSSQGSNTASTPNAPSILNNNADSLVQLVNIPTSAFENNNQESETESIKHFLNHDQNTHSAAVSSSMDGFYCQELLKRYAGNNIESIDIAINEMKKFVVEKKVSLGLNDDDIENLKKYVELLEKASVDGFDAITFFSGDILHSEPHLLKEVFGVVCAAILASENKVNNDANKEQARLDRVRPLIVVILELATRGKNGAFEGLGFCHTGVRHELIGVLNGVEVGADFVVDINSAFVEITKEVIKDSLLEIKDAKEQLKIWLLLVKEINVEDDKLLKEFVEKVAKKFEHESKKFCKDHYIDLGEESEAAKKITGTIEFIETNDLLNQLPITFHKNSALVYDILLFIKKIKDKDLKQKLKTMVESFESASMNEIDQKFKNLHLVIHAYLLCSNENRAKLWGSEGLPAIKELKEKCLFYIGNIAKDTKDADIPRIVELKKKVEESLCKLNYYDFIENFLALYYEYMWENDAEAIKMYERLVTMESVLNLNDDAIDAMIENMKEENEKEKELNLFGEKISYITIYQINRILLHAILTSPKKWTPKFHGLLVSVGNFIKNSFNLPQVNNDFRAKGLEYYINFLPQLELLESYWLKLTDRSANAVSPLCLEFYDILILPNLDGLSKEEVGGDYEYRKVSILKLIKERCAYNVFGSEDVFLAIASSEAAVEGYRKKYFKFDDFKGCDVKKIRALISDGALEGYRLNKFTFNDLKNLNAGRIEALTSLGALKGYESKYFEFNYLKNFYAKEIEALTSLGALKGYESKYFKFNDLEYFYSGEIKALTCSGALKGYESKYFEFNDLKNLNASRIEALTSLGALKGYESKCFEFNDLVDFDVDKIKVLTSPVMCQMYKKDNSVFDCLKNVDSNKLKTLTSIKLVEECVIEEESGYNYHAGCNLQ